MDDNIVRDLLGESPYEVPVAPYELFIDTKALKSAVLETLARCDDAAEQDDVDFDYPTLSMTFNMLMIDSYTNEHFEAVFSSKGGRDKVSGVASMFCTDYVLPEISRMIRRTGIVGSYLGLRQHQGGVIVSIDLGKKDTPYRAEPLTLKGE